MTILTKGLMVSSIILFLVVSALPAVSAYSNAAPAKAVDCLAGNWSDGFGNNFHFKGESGSCTSSYRIKGQLTSSSYLPNTPWKSKGTGSGSSFTFVNKDSDPSNGFCSFSYTGTVSGTAPDQTASGSWQNLKTGSSDCTGSGSFTMVQTSAGPVITFTGGLPGVAS
jgi:hypothetical protein